MTYDKNSFLAGLAVGRALWRPPYKAAPLPFDDQPVPVAHGGDEARLVGIPIYHLDRQYKIAVSEPGVYAFAAEDGSALRLYLAAERSVLTTKFIVHPGGGSAADVNIVLYDATTGLYYRDTSFSSWTVSPRAEDLNENFPLFVSLRDGLDGLYAHLYGGLWE